MSGSDITAFWLIRHALVDEASRGFLYGTMDVPICEATLLRQDAVYHSLAQRLPRPADWFVTPASRTRRTAGAIFAAGYPEQHPAVVADLREQGLGDWQGLVHDALPARLTRPAHTFWPLGGDERPPGGESMGDVIARVGPCLEDLAARHRGRQVVAVSHGGAIRACVAHALRIVADNALHLSIQNLSLTRLERHPHAWRVICVNELGT